MKYAALGFLLLTIIGFTSLYRMPDSPKLDDLPRAFLSFVALTIGGLGLALLGLAALAQALLA